MRLIDSTTLEQVEFFGHNIPSYAILSHTWAHDEITLDELIQQTGHSKDGYQKLMYCAQQAARHGIPYLWMDTCCIDKRSSAELSEAINSMFRWYKDAAVCYVYLTDVSVRSGHDNDWVSLESTSTARPLEHHRPEISFLEGFRLSKWFTRGWTLQELLAPTRLKFFDRYWEFIGDRSQLQQQISEISGIPVGALQGEPLSSYSVAERMSWAENRVTTRIEDAAYCLLGIFDVNMPLLYGEGRKSFHRLRKKIEESEHYRSRAGESTKSALTEAGKSAVPHREKTQPSSSPADPVQQNPEPGEDVGSNEDDEWQYPDNGLPESSFRLLKLEKGVMGDRLVGTIHVYNLSEPPIYHALSYTWGQEPDLHPIFVNGKKRRIRSNLYHALQRIRSRDGDLLIWIDSICINQENDTERNYQVRQMANIYNKSEVVFIWLGEEDSTSKLALDLIEEIIKPTFPWAETWWEKEYGFVALAEILERAWFRRRWVLQEAALAKNAKIHCGDRTVHMDMFAAAINLVRASLQTLPATILTNFRDSPAVWLLDTIHGAFRRSDEGSNPLPKFSLEHLVDLARFSDATNHRDTIYALLSLANDSIMTSTTQVAKIDPDYSKTVLDVYADFIQHCVHHSDSLDIICRPWAPTPSKTSYIHQLKDFNATSLPSWIATRDRLPFGEPSLRYTHRINGNTFVGSSEKRTYRVHHNSVPSIRVGRMPNGNCNGALYVKGVALGEVGKRSTRMASAIISKECLEILGTITYYSYSKLMNIPEAIWRTLCADNGDNGFPASPFYQSAMLHILQLNYDAADETETTSNVLEHLNSVDVEELLEGHLPAHVRRFLEMMQDVIWNRRTFRTKPQSATEGSERSLVGLIPQSARIGDTVCILYGCSVPVVLRKIPSSGSSYHWQLIGEAFVEGIMGGEAIRFATPSQLKEKEAEFEIR
jgi:hypothetical protein